jgi:hypothetical protein
MVRSRCRTAVLAFVATLAFGALTAVPALASGLPTVETKPATGVSATAATLNGVVNPNGAETKYHFDYGAPPPFYGKKTAEVSAGAGTSNVEVSQAIAALTPNTEYHFRLVATNANGTTNGTDMVFTTSHVVGPPEFVGYAENKATLSNKEAVTFSTIEGGFYIKCSKGVTAPVSITGPKALTATLTFTGCREEVLGNSVACSSACAAVEEIKTGSLEGGLFYSAKAAKEVAIVFNFRNKGVFASATCNTSKVEVKQGPIVPITPINTSMTTHSLSFKVSSGRQSPSEYENEVSAKIHYVPLINTPGSTFFEEGGISASLNTTLVTARPLEVTG